MTKSKIKVFAFLTIFSTLSMTACKSGSGYGCDYTATESMPLDIKVNQNKCTEYTMYTVVAEE